MGGGGVGGFKKRRAGLGVGWGVTSHNHQSERYQGAVVIETWCTFFEAPPTPTALASHSNNIISEAKKEKRR